MHPLVHNKVYRTVGTQIPDIGQTVKEFFSIHQAGGRVYRSHQYASYCILDDYSRWSKIYSRRRSC